MFGDEGDAIPLTATHRSTVALRSIRLHTAKRSDQGKQGRIQHYYPYVGFVEALTSTNGFEAVMHSDRMHDVHTPVHSHSGLRRAHRSVSWHPAALLDRADRARWSLVILDADVDTTTAGGRLVANVLGSVSEWERMVIGERTKAALAQRKAEGVRLGRPVELPDETRQLVKALSDDGLSLRAIAARLTEQGIQTAKGGKWHASTVKAVLSSLELDVASA